LLAEGICYSEIKISKDCYCPGVFTFKIKNEDCEPVDCDSLVASLEKEEIKIGKYIEHRWSNECDFTFEAPDGFEIDTIVNLLEFRNCDTSITDSSFSFTFGCMGGIGAGVPDYRGSAYSKTLEILVRHKITGDTCLLTKKFTCSCPGSIRLDIETWQHQYTSMMIADYEISNEEEEDDEGLRYLLPLTFYLNDNMGNRLKTLHTVNHSGQFSGQFTFNMLEYPVGTYHITVENNEQILGSEKFMFVR
jgi:hypothetical protein